MDQVSVEAFLPGTPTENAAGQDEAVKEMGLIRLSKKALDSINQTGISISGFGATRFADGCAAITASSLVRLLEKLSERLEEKISQDELQQLAQSMTLVAKSMVGLTGVIKGRGMPLTNIDPSRSTFPAHAKVTFVQNQTIVESKSDSV